MSAPSPYPKLQSGRCIKRVPGGTFRGHQCRRAAVVGGEWCKFHAPDAVRARQEAKSARWEAEYAAKKRGWHLAELHRAIADAALTADPNSLPPLVCAAVEAYRDAEKRP